MKSWLSLILFLGVSFSLPGCAHCSVTNKWGCGPPSVKIELNEPIINGNPALSNLLLANDLVQFSELKKQYSRALDWYKTKEWKFNHVSQEQPPELCICLSGGGVRSASFSIGVLKALSERNVIQNVDVLSGASGGAYTIGWLYSNLYKNPEGTIHQLFEESTLENLIQNSGFILNPDVIVTTILRTPFNFLKRLTTSEDTPYTATSERNQGPVYARALAATFLQGQRDLRVSELVSVIQVRRLPLFIINAGVRADAGSYKYADKPRMADMLVEITPLRVWGDGVGLGVRLRDIDYAFFRLDETLYGTSRRPRRELDFLADALSVSGAAVDFSGKESPTGIISHQFGFDLGRYFPFASHGVAFLYEKFFGQQQYRAQDLDYPYLYDGGKVDNLATFSVVRRLCHNILIVDAEYDPDYHFGAYVKLRRALRREMNVDLAVSELDAVLDVEAVDKEDYGELCGGNGCRKGLFDGSHPIMRGTIKYFLSIPPGPSETETTKAEALTLNVWYLKLSVDSKLVSEPPSTESFRHLEAAYGKPTAAFITVNRSEDCTRQDLLACQNPFPQYPTARQVFTPERMRAYIDLGYRTVQKRLNDAPWR